MKARSAKVILVISSLSMAAVLFMALLLIKPTAANTSMRYPVDLSGTWHQTTADHSKMNMVAEITDDHIQITMYMNDFHGLYWDGSFDTSKSTTNSFKITSVSEEQVLSQDKTKIFTYKNGELSYQFTMLGQTNTVHLSKGE